MMEVISCNDVISSLWSPHSVEKCKLGLCDVILFENNVPVRWYVTGSAGEVKLKRTVDIRGISKRWLTISEQLNSFYIAAIRQDDSIVKFISIEAWKNFVEEKKFEGAISSIHSIFGSGSSIIIYRSSYSCKLIDENRSVTTRTQTYTVPIGDPVYTLYLDQIKLTESKASQINKVIDLATSAIIRYVERVLKIVLLEFSVDFIIDEKSQIWMLWTNRTAFSRRNQPKSPKVSNGSLFDGDAFDETLTASLNQHVKEVSETASKATQSKSPLKRLSSTHTFIPADKAITSNERKFPNPFQCHGDYCNVCIQANGALSIENNKAQLHTANKFFSESEIEKLRKDPRYNSMMEFGSTGFGVAEISMKSISVARKEQRGIKSGGDLLSWKEYPVSPDSTLKFGPIEVGNTAESNQASFRSDSQVDSDDYPSNFALHYELVKVCGVCYNIYRCLDWARELLRPEVTFKKQPRLSTQILSSDTTKIAVPRLGHNVDQNSSVTAKATWKSRLQSNGDRTVKKVELNALENYVRGKSSNIFQNNNISKTSQFSSEPLNKDSSIVEDNRNLYFGQVLLACSNYAASEQLKNFLLGAKYRVLWFRDGRQAINEIIANWEQYDCIITDRNLDLVDCFELCRAIRDHEKLLRNNLAKSGTFQKLNHRLPVICCTEETSAVDLSNYMRADMDGCISMPIHQISVLNTIRAAIPHHLAPISNSNTLKESAHSKKVMELGLLGVPVNSDSSSTMALKTLPIPKQSSNNEYHGIAQLDADTKIPFSVLNGSKFARARNIMQSNFFNLVVCQDIFDTYERMKIILQPIVQRYQAIQILIWNYPGQSNTEWRSTQVLNNDYLAGCLNELLGQIGEHGTNDFSTDHPFYVLGYGFGANIASFYLSHYRAPNVRGLISVNGWAYVDSYLAGVMHDCINIFHSTPNSRPDLPVYFFSRYLFSKDYLARVSVPLALNIYTAVYNAISIPGRIQLCNGVLQSIDIRKLLKSIECPLICLHTNQNAFSRPLHVEPFVVCRNGEVRSIHATLQNPSKTCVVWLDGGHEVFQENKKQIVLLLEQILTGYHDVHEITFPSAASSGLPANGKLDSTDDINSASLEDKFTKSVLNFTNKLSKQPPIPGLSTTSRVDDKNESIMDAETSINTIKLPSISRSAESVSWQQYSEQASKTLTATIKTDISKSQIATVDGKKNEENVKLPYISDVQSFPEVKEYMNWRLKRNKKRLQRLQLAAQAIQNAFRAYMARKFVKNIRKIKAASIIQRVFRGWHGRKKFYLHARRLWASIIIQKNWRGYSARKWYFNLLVKIAASADIQRIFRGFRARRKVKAIRIIQNKASAKIQSMFRMFRARKEAWRRRMLRNSAITIQRVFRGFCGRKRSIAERDKYIFSKSQSQGIEFGRQMLLEHKLHVTKLQTDVSLLSQEKTAAEEQIEALLEEIGGFEEGVRMLEKEMHQLSKIESEAAAFMDEDSRFELREQKMRLDREFGEMLSKIANRKDMLNDLERKLAVVDKSRQAKEEDLRTLERKLVVLLEDQQKELNAIKRKQDVRGTLLVASHNELSKVTAGNGANAGAGDKSGNVSLGSQSGPSLQEKKQAAQLMQSTETLMKFGFMSMSMTYFSSLNMIKALRTVSAQDTVMAALADSQNQKESHSSIEKPLNLEVQNRPGKLPGQQQLQVSAWSVSDVSNWLQTLSLGQYSEAFIDSAIDGEFLYDINDDDLKNTLGIEHRLHRKKILNSISRLKQAELQREARLGQLQTTLFDVNYDQSTATTANGQTNQTGFQGANDDLQDRTIDGPKVSLSELLSIVRHSKFSSLKDSIDYLPSKPFDKSLVQSPYVADHGTVYLAGYERLPFHINKTDEFGNTLLTLSCQNGNAKICKYLLSKGANPNHQNRHGQTPAHFAIAYQFYDLSQFLFENGGDDTIENKFGLSPYDGLSNEVED